MMPEHLRRAFLLHSQLPIFGRRIRQAKDRVAAWLGAAGHGYCAYSAGKDSQVCLTLVREQDPNIPAIYFDAQCSFPEVDELLDRTTNLIRFPADEPFLETLGRCGLSGLRVEQETMRTTVYGPIRRLIAKHGFDGVCYGLRAEESRGRALHAYKRGAIFQYRHNGLWACQPIWDWTYNDVWAFIIWQGLPYCGTYDKLWDAPCEDQRLSYWAGETKRRWGRYAWLKRNYPDLFNKLAAAVPEVRSYV